MSTKITIKGNTFESGDEVTLIYSTDPLVIDGVLCIGEEPNNFWFCSNSPIFNGDKAPEMFGYKYSYYYSVNTIENSTALLFHRIKIKYINPSDYLKSDIQTFIKNNVSDYYFLFGIKNSLIELYDLLTTSEEKGMVVLHSSTRNKKLSIKMGRLIRRLATSFSELISENPKNNTKFNIADEYIEKIHNLFVSQNDKSLRHEIVSGTDIIKGYTRSFYADGRGTLHNSCMTDKFNYLKIYTDNPDKVSLAIFYDNTNKICARALIWSCDDGNTYYDRIYYTIDWQNNTCVEILKGLGYTPIFQTTIAATVKLSNLDFLEYPYLDTFFGLSFKKKKLYYDPHGNKKIRYELRTTTGQIYERYNSNDLDYE